MENTMDEIKQLNIQAMSKSRQLYFSKKAFKILLSLSAFICLVSYSMFLPFVIHSYHCYLSTFYSTDRRYIFLLCNGILVFLIKNSGPIANSPVTTHFKDNRIKKTGQVHQPVFELSSEMKLVVVEEATVEEEEEENGILVIDDNSGSTTQDDIKDEQVKHFLIVQEDKIEDEKADFLNVQEDEKTTEASTAEEEEEEQEQEEVDEEEEEGSAGFLNAEELNQRCEEFIRKMKERIKDEAHH